MKTSISPAFPTDLEREIFELAANCHPETMLSLMLVAHRVHQWIEPLLYRFLVIDLSFRPTIATSAVCLQEPTRWAKHVQVVLVMFPAPVLQRILPICTAIRKLALYDVRSSVLPVIKELQLRELLFDPTLPMFRELTHLRVHNITEDCSFTQFPALTHLSFNAQNAGGALLASTLAHCSKIRVLVGILWSQWNIELWDQSTDDLRLVLMCTTRKDEVIADWQAGARGESDMWTRAEIFIAKRRRGETQPCLIPGGYCARPRLIFIFFLLASRCWIEDSDLI
ncbi:hypothetical protein C8J57DRAFT_1343335 [Mycena rebaudengoi]|nr:hypothetical protein C8J57DRAFT_1343335 [Mycena rebaudengoi]